MHVHATELWITIVLFVAVSGMGFFAAQWRRPVHLTRSTSGPWAAGIRQLDRLVHARR